MHWWVCPDSSGACHSRAARPVFMCASPSCPEACYPDVRLWALRARQESVVAIPVITHTLFYIVCIHTHTQIAPPSFPFSLASHCDTWDLSWSPCASLWWNKSGVCVCVWQAASALSPSLHCWYTFGWKHRTHWNMQVVTFSHCGYNLE